MAPGAGSIWRSAPTRWWTASCSTGDRATGVATTEGELHAEHVVLAAGAYGSPGILLRSDIGPARGLPVGEGLIDHVGVGFGFEPTERLQREAAAFERERPLYMAQVTIEARSTACAEGVCDLFFFPALDPPGDAGYEVSAAVFAMKPRLARDASAWPRPTRARRWPSTTASSPTSATSRCSSRASRRCGGWRGARPFAPMRRARRARAPTSTPSATCASAARGFFHPVGTCAIGAVVDGDGRVHGIDGLSVADASIMPSIPRANTNLSTIALAERLAERMLGVS